ncbi:chaplin family protein [Streptomyces lutosisoli]|uniref:Chaplin family protein n=1 Tax=Streptomyces lutosisoli TaxID=2665721 RepID=A0ABW2VM53_9ACTN
MATAATGILFLYATPGFADSNANGAATDSPGVASGNNVQVPVHVPVNACGNTVNVIAALNPAFGNSCANSASSSPLQGAPSVSPGDDDSSGSGSSAHGVAYDSPGVLSGNTAQTPVDVPVNACGNTVNVIAALNPAFGNSCANSSSSSPLQGAPSVSPGDDDSPGSGSSAHGVAYDSPGVLSGNTAQTPVDVPVNACGNAVGVIGVLNPAFGNQCANEAPSTTPLTVPPVVVPPAAPLPDSPVVVPPAAPLPDSPVVVPPAAPLPDCPVVVPPAAPLPDSPVVVPPAAPLPDSPVVVPPRAPLPDSPVVVPPRAPLPDSPSLTGHEQPPGASPTLPHTGSEGVLAASAASVALLAGGTLLYRRGRAASRR